MQLLMTVERRQAGIVGGKIHFDFLISADRDYILHHACSGYSRDPGELKTVPMKTYAETRSWGTEKTLTSKSDERKIRFKSSNSPSELASLPAVAALRRRCCSARSGKTSIAVL